MRRLALVSTAITLLVALPQLHCDDAASGPDDDPLEAVDIVSACTVPTVPSPSAVNLQTDVTYATMDGQPQRLDIAWPLTSAPPRGLVVVLHGGAWHDGDKAAHRDDILLLAGQGYVAASVNYRLAASPANVFPAAVEDARCAVRWLRANAGTYGIDPSRVVALGYSAGGHLAAMLGTAADVAGLDGACPITGQPIAVNGIVAFYAPHDLRDVAGLQQFQRDLIANFLGAPANSVPAKAALASPVVHASAGDPPALLVHGTFDLVVPIESSRALRTALRAAGTRATIVEVDRAGHGFPAFAASRTRSSCTTLAFLSTLLGD